MSPKDAGNTMMFWGVVMVIIGIVMAISAGRFDFLFVSVGGVLYYLLGRWNKNN